MPGAHKTPTSVWVTVVGHSDDASLQAERDGRRSSSTLAATTSSPTSFSTRDVAVFDTTGDRLRYECYCDGLPELDYLAQVDGVRLSAPVEDPDARAQVEGLLDHVLSTVRIQD